MMKLNETLQGLFERKSVRVFEEKAVSAEDKQLILRACVEAPSAGNQQLYTILDITDTKLKAALADACDHQPFIASAPFVLVFVADCLKYQDAYEVAGAEPRLPGKGDLMLAVTDTCIAAQNAVTAAHSLGLGSCYIGDIMENREIMRVLLHLPKYTFPCAMLVFGYPTQQQLDRPKPERFSVSDILCENSYVRKTEPELRKMFDKRCSGDFDGWMHAFCKRKYNSDFSREMTRSVSGYLEDFST